MVLGFRVRRRPKAITHGTASAATASRHGATFHALVTDGDAENRARRRKDALMTAVGSGARKSAAGTRYEGPKTAARISETIPKITDPSNIAKAAAAYRRTIGR